MKELLKLFSIQLVATLLITPIILNACDREHDYQQAKYEQWERDRLAERPYTDFNR